ncbi:unnamed protein product [Prorocentrum cordatum]|uniref:AB hydrolase-1 domain-containing protein n=1 Tax=Prorocentrum cordatum TaxID=2364126 RepID=A0ABN9U5D9_9DINO|nr:unnamed protein product [Polarella glacialis]
MRPAARERHVQRGVQADALRLPHRPDVRTACLGGRLHLALVDLLGHGCAPPLPLNGQDTDWAPLAQQVQDVVAACDAAAPQGLGDRTVVGHSLGGGSAVLAQWRARGPLFSRMFLYEPMYLFEARALRAAGLPGDLQPTMQSPVVRKAMARRSQWDDRAAAAADLSRKALFAQWDPRAFAGYLDGGLVADGGAARLACAPRTEASIFASSTPAPLLEALRSRGGALRGAPLCVAMGAGGEDAPPSLWRPAAVGEVFGGVRPRPRTLLVDGAGHMWPLERPAGFAAAVAEEFGWAPRASL